MTQNFTFFYESTSPFSNWYMSHFVHNSCQYNCSEQYMMHMKAKIFKDHDVADLIMEQSHPRKQKFLGRQVRNFDNNIWMEKCQDVMVEGLISKFTQDTYCLNALLDTDDTVIVEASPVDKVWGIGLAANHPDAKDPTKWLGKNLLGVVLMKTRDEIKYGRH